MEALLGARLWAKLPEALRAELEELEAKGVKGGKGAKGWESAVFRALHPWADERAGALFERRLGDNPGAAPEWRVRFNAEAPFLEEGAIEMSRVFGLAKLAKVLAAEDPAAELAQETGRIAGERLEKIRSRAEAIRAALGRWSEALGVEKTVHKMIGQGVEKPNEKDFLKSWAPTSSETEALSALAPFVEFSSKKGVARMFMEVSTRIAGRKVSVRLARDEILAGLAKSGGKDLPFGEAMAAAKRYFEGNLAGNLAEWSDRCMDDLRRELGRGEFPVPEEATLFECFLDALPAPDAPRSEGAVDAGEIRLATHALGTLPESLAKERSRRALDFGRVRQELELAEKAMRALPERLEQFYPKARALGRKLTLVVGPTNSGKTHRAVEKIKACQGKSAYLAPLRLLALEVRDRLLDEGVKTSLLTGELVEEAEGATCVSATIEMLNFDESFDLCVIDEAQMIEDPQRGGAWLAALLGAPAKELWLLGAPESESVVSQIADLLGEELEVVRLERLSPFSVDREPTALNRVPAKSAVVAFSRRDVLAIAAELNAAGKSTAVVYGALSPEVRKEQARRFREGEADVVVATDAIGMGLNLPIASIYFSDHEKWDGTKREGLVSALVWQIAGRAGRFGMHESGTVGALTKQSLSYVKGTLGFRPGQVDFPVGFDANWPTVEVISRHLKSEKLAVCLDFFAKRLRFGGEEQWFLPKVDAEQMELAMVLDSADKAARSGREAAPGLDLKVKHQFSRAPAPREKGFLCPEFANFMQSMARDRATKVEDCQWLAPNRREDQESAEKAVKVLTMYCWMSNRSPEFFPDFDLAREWIGEHESVIDEHLKAGRKSAAKRCRSCQDPLPWNHRFAICESCFKDRDSRWS